MRFFRISDQELYEIIRIRLDNVLNLPSPDGLTITCISPADQSPKDDTNRILLALDHVFCSHEEVSKILSELLSSDVIEEVTKEEYLSTIKIYPNLIS